jgi:methyltransferase (TIGR00027 family)
MFVSLARGLLSVPGHGRSRPIDLVAPSLLPRSLARLIATAHRAPWIVAPLRLASFGLVDHQGRRTLAIDEAVAQAIADGAAQLVILGAGLDARAWRLEGLDGVKVFEVDHPSTQGWKRKRAPAGDGPVFVSVDFERESIDAKLAAAGHSATAPTVWIWEGVTMYLPREAIAGTLAIVTARSAPGSTLCVTYLAPEEVSFGPLLLGLAEVFLRVFGEPFRGMLSPGEMGSMVSAAGLDPVSDTGPAEWSAEHGYPAPVVGIGERLLIARRPASKG